MIGKRWKRTLDNEFVKGKKITAQRNMTGKDGDLKGNSKSVAVESSYDESNPKRKVTRNKQTLIKIPFTKKILYKKNKKTVDVEDSRTDKYTTEKSTKTQLLNKKPKYKIKKKKGKKAKKSFNTGINKYNSAMLEDHEDVRPKEKGVKGIKKSGNIIMREI